MSDLCPVAVGQDLLENEHQPETAGESHLLLLKQMKYCDVTFTFPNHPDGIAAHELYLKARSPVFTKIFRMRKSGNVQGDEIRISDSTPDVFRQFLEFMYADKLEVDIAGALDLLQLSHKYKVHPLTKKCEELLKTDIPIVDSVKVFEAARRYGRRELMDRAGLIMVKSFLKLARTGALANAEEETFVYLLSSDDLVLKEVELFEIILKWGKNQVGSTADMELLSNKLKNLISKIRFTNMAPEEFTKVVVPTGLLSAEETISVYSYFCGDAVTRRDLKIKFNKTRRGLEKLLAAAFAEPTMSGEGVRGWDLPGSSSPNYAAPRKATPAGGARPFQTNASPRSSGQGKPPPRGLQITSGDNSTSLVSASTSQDASWKLAPIFAQTPAPKVDVGPRRGALKDTHGAFSGRDDHRHRFRDDRGTDRSWRDDQADQDNAFRDCRSNIDNRDQVYRSGMTRGLDRRGGPGGPPKHKDTHSSVTISCLKREPIDWNLTLSNFSLNTTKVITSVNAFQTLGDEQYD